MTVPSRKRVAIERAADLRYYGQSFELTVPVPIGTVTPRAQAGIEAAFGREHEPVELVGLRVVARGIAERAGVLAPGGEADITPGIDQSIYGYGREYGLPQGHTGDDIGLARGTQLYMPAGLTGTVEIAGGTPGKGELRIRLSNGDSLIYGHTSQIGVRQGQQLTGGQAVAQVGSANGDHLHLEVRRRNSDGSYRLVDPAAYFGR